MLDHASPDFENVGYTPLAVEEHTQPHILSEGENRVARHQFLALCLSLFLIGWNDGSIGPILHRIQEYYDVRTFFHHASIFPEVPRF